MQYVAIQTSEKVSYNVSVTATGTSGHASIPLADNSVVHLAAAVQKLGTMETPVQLLTITRRYFEQLAPVEDEDTAKWIRALDTPERADLAARRLAAMNPVWNAMLRDTITPTELNAGVRANVIPARGARQPEYPPAAGQFDTGHHPANAKGRERSAGEVYGRSRMAGQTPPPLRSHRSFIRRSSAWPCNNFPARAVVPYFPPARPTPLYLRLHNVQAYGLLPFPLTEADLSRMHGDDERIPIASFRTGVDFCSTRWCMISSPNK